MSDDVLSDLKQRLSRARFADEISDSGWDYGANLDYMKSLVAYWRDKYDWRAQERRLNEFEQFKTRIDGLDVHFVHRRSNIPGAVPLLLLNGWPSSIEEYAKVIGPLADPRARDGQATAAFDVVIPSMPGYGFSDKPRTRGYNPERIAHIWATLMARLGYARYVAHGSDWGIAVASYLALHDSAHMTALHLAGCPGGLTAPAMPPRAGTPPAPVSSNLGYQEIQTTKPQTLGQGLSDSPLGLASWIIDKWHSWSDHVSTCRQTACGLRRLVQYVDASTSWCPPGRGYPNARVPACFSSIGRITCNVPHTGRNGFRGLRQLMTIRGKRLDNHYARKLLDLPHFW